MPMHLGLYRTQRIHQFIELRCLALGYVPSHRTMQDILRMDEAEKAEDLKQELLQADGGCISAIALAASLNSTPGDIEDLEAQELSERNGAQLKR